MLNQHSQSLSLTLLPGALGTSLGCLLGSWALPSPQPSVMVISQVMFPALQGGSLGPLTKLCHQSHLIIFPHPMAVCAIDCTWQMKPSSVKSHLRGWWQQILHSPIPCLRFVLYWWKQQTVSLGIASLTLGIELGPLPSMVFSPDSQVLQQGWPTELCGGTELGHQMQMHVLLFQALASCVRPLHLFEPQLPRVEVTVRRVFVSNNCSEAGWHHTGLRAST